MLASEVLPLPVLVSVLVCVVPVSVPIPVAVSVSVLVSEEEISPLEFEPGFVTEVTGVGVEIERGSDLGVFWGGRLVVVVGFTVVCRTGGDGELTLAKTGSKERMV